MFLPSVLSRLQHFFSVNPVNYDEHLSTELKIKKLEPGELYINLDSPFNLTLKPEFAKDILAVWVKGW